MQRKRNIENIDSYLTKFTSVAFPVTSFIWSQIFFVKRLHLGTQVAAPKCLNEFQSLNVTVYFEIREYSNILCLLKKTLFFAMEKPFGQEIT